MAKSRGETLPTEARFDSNCITPGTAFMDRLHKQLQYFVVNKLSTDKLWHGVTVYLSGHEVRLSLRLSVLLHALWSVSRSLGSVFLSRFNAA